MQGRRLTDLDFLRGASRDAEVQKFRASLRQHDIAWLQIAVDDPLPVRLFQGISDLNGVALGLIQGQRAFLQSLGERPTLQALHDQEVGIALLADVVQSADVRVVQGCNSAGLTLEPLLEIRIGSYMLRQHFDGDGAVKARVSRPVDLPHPPGADQADNLVGA